MRIVVLIGIPHVEPSQLVEDDSKSPDVQFICTLWAPLSRFDPDKGTIGSVDCATLISGRFSGRTPPWLSMDSGPCLSCRGHVRSETMVVGQFECGSLLARGAAGELPTR
jgi:hypothetical protein